MAIIFFSIVEQGNYLIFYRKGGSMVNIIMRQVRDNDINGIKEIAKEAF